MAQAIFEGIDRYFRESPPPDTYFAAVKRGTVAPSNDVREYIIASGDTLSGISARHNISVAELQRHNGLADSAIRVGQKIQIPPVQ